MALTQMTSEPARPLLHRLARGLVTLDRQAGVLTDHAGEILLGDGRFGAAEARRSGGLFAGLFSGLGEDG